MLIIAWMKPVLNVHIPLWILFMSHECPSIYHNNVCIDRAPGDPSYYVEDGDLPCTEKVLYEVTPTDRSIDLPYNYSSLTVLISSYQLLHAWMLFFLTIVKYDFP